MQGRAFLDVARDVLPKAKEPHWRATVIHAYYALMLECRDALARWRIPIVPRQNAHSAVRLRFLYASDRDLKEIGSKLDDWGRHRNDASYNLTSLRQFASDALAQCAIKEAAAALALLDAIEADPTRRRHRIVPAVILNFSHRKDDTICGAGSSAPAFCAAAIAPK